MFENLELGSILEKASDNIIGDGPVPVLSSMEGDYFTDFDMSDAQSKWEVFIDSCIAEQYRSLETVLPMLAEELVSVGEFFLLKFWRKQVLQNGEEKWQIKYYVRPSESLARGYSGYYVKDGVKIDEFTGEVKSYFFIKDNLWNQRQPYALTFGDMDVIEIPAHAVIHCFVPKQFMSRGYPTIVSMLEPAENVTEFRNAEIRKQSINAHFSLAVTSKHRGRRPKLNELTDGVDPWSQDPSGPNHTKNYNIKDGTVIELPEGVEVQTIAPSKGDTPTQDLISSTLGILGSRLGVSRPSIDGDLSKMSYSSGKFSMIENKKVHRRFRRLLEKQVYRVMWDDFLRLEYPTVYTDVRTIPISWSASSEWVLDPEKQSTAVKRNLRSGFMSWSELAASKGVSLEQLFESLQGEQAMAEKYNLKYDSMPWSDTDRENYISTGGNDADDTSG
ncbi:phage portal protein [Photobacterium phosphoreum]|uniref:phage portal protein n=1 Tax=Photobacterium phosphoreum TaxID=659 RepID=UPI0024B7BC81|nr:phage portal protein [Photobacterium phosphoreum]